ncbi:hypothetical protein [Planctomycetes bacterium K23_9]|uniref:Uncharacterized protein n=1 Tax=Stieleria marina TaxID=1930275 RepID=A0A517NX38_9BACT|nr:hypothetical protein K239x_37000 [Planctomycetes bacterium K23_9]
MTNKSHAKYLVRPILIGAWLAATLLLAGIGTCDEPAYPIVTPKDRSEYLKQTPWIEVIEREVPPLANDLGDRMPMIMWHGVGFGPLSPQQIKVLRDRGLTQHLQMDASMIPAALNLQAAGMPVILMQGRTDNWPYSLAENADDWAHQFDVTYQPKWFGDDDAFAWHGACPHKTDGWKILARQTRDTMKQFRDAGVKVTGVWMDLEGDPYPWAHLFDQLKHCRRCRAELPADIVNNQAAWRDDAWRRYVNLYDQHFAKSIRDVFPECLVTNWHVVVSTTNNPIRYFVRDVNLPELSLNFFNTTNPIAYGCDVGWLERPWPEQGLGDSDTQDVQALTQKMIDDFYYHEIVQQVQADHKNRTAAGTPHLTAIPWIARHCRIDTQQRAAPLMTRERYRSALAELWRHDLTTMQVFNAMHDGYEQYAVTELQDAVLALDATLADRPETGAAGEKQTVK